MAKKSTTARLNFTKRTLEALHPRGEQRVYYHDTQQPGLCLAVSPLGRKTFVLYRKIQGRPERIHIGPFPDLSIEQARGRAAALNAEIAKGLNPAQAQRALRQQLTLGDLFGEYLARHVAVHNKSPRNVQWLFDACLSPLRSLRLHEIRRADVVRLHTEIGRVRGPYAANRAIELLRTLFNRATDWEFHNGPSPALGIPAFREQKRERFLREDELPRFFKALAEEPNRDLRDLILLALLTGARRGNAQAMRWGDVNLDAALWTIPPGEAKAGETILVPLVPAAVEILKQRHQNNGGSPWVFPSRGKTGHLVEPKVAWRRLLARAGLTDVRLHDLRRSLGSWMVATGASLPIIGKALGHRSLAATQVYARLDLDPVRRAVEAGTNAMLMAARLPPVKTGKRGRLPSS